MKKSVVFWIILLILVLTPLIYFFSPTINQNIGENITEKMIESQTGTKVNIDSDGEDVTIKTKDGQTQYSADGDVKFPDGFPQELVIMDDAKLIISSSSEIGSSLTYLTDSDQTAVFDKYITNIPVLGWENNMEVNAGQGKMINISKGSEAAVITIGENNTKDTSLKTLISITYTEDKDI